MKKSVKVCLPLVAMMIVAGCAKTGTTPVSSSLTGDSSSSSSEAEVVADGITLKDNIGSYTVGETLSSVFDVAVSIHYSDGTSKDVSAKPAYFNLVVKNSAGATVDTDKPFTAAGSYTIQAVYRTNKSIVSDPVTIQVKDQVSTVLSAKSEATKVFNYADVENSSLSNLSYPTTGTVNSLVIPLEISDYPFATFSSHGANYRTALDHTFNGDGATDTGYWESVASFYRKSSLGKLDFKFEIAPTFVSGKSSSDLDKMYKSNASYYTAVDMVEAAIDNYRTANGGASLKKFDNDGDGYIDGLWVVYSAPDYASSTAISKLTNKDIFWAFCTDTDKYAADVNAPTLHSFGWASETFMNEGATAPKVDAHTFIHETGHLLSLTDYYSYDIQSSSSSGCEGGLAMMDLNIGDQDSFSKIALGWANPYVVTDDCVVTINPNESSGDCVLLADNWNGSVCDEYMLFDLQTPTGLNALDATSAYNYRPLYFNKAGVRAYHVDARMATLKQLYAGETFGGDSIGKDGTYFISDDTQSDYYLTDAQVQTLLSKTSLPRMSTDKTASVDARTPGYTIMNGNCASRAGLSDKPYSANRLLTIVTRDSVNCETDLKYASASSLFQAGDSWSLTRKGAKYFTTVPGKLNNGNALNWVVTVLAVSDSSATLQFRKY